MQNYIQLSNAKINNLELSTKRQSKSVLWKDARKIRLTASSASKIPVKDTTDATAFIREHLHPKFTGNKYIGYGNEQEPIAKEHLKSLGHTVTETGMYVSAQEQWLSGSPDEILNGDTLLEIKCPVPIPGKWNILNELIEGGKYDIVKNYGKYVLKTK